MNSSQKQSYNCPPKCSHCNTLHYRNERCIYLSSDDSPVVKAVEKILETAYPIYRNEASDCSPKGLEDEKG